MTNSFPTRRSSDLGSPLGSIAVEEFAAAAGGAFAIEAITILAQSGLVARLAGKADGGVLAAGVAFEVVAELPVEDGPGASGAFLAGGACRRGGGAGTDADALKVGSTRANRPRVGSAGAATGAWFTGRSEEHTSELQALMRISYAGF